jgi:hypothetical protein
VCQKIRRGPLFVSHLGGHAQVLLEDRNVFGCDQSTADFPCSIVRGNAAEANLPVSIVISLSNDIAVDGHLEGWNQPSLCGRPKKDFMARLVRSEINVLRLLILCSRDSAGS